LPTKYLHINETPTLTVSPDPDSLCSGEPVSITLTSCLSGSTINWSGNSHTGTSNISDTINNVSNVSTSTTYTATATSNGCTSPPVSIPVVVDPLPNANFTYSTPCVTGVPVVFSDNSQIFAATASGWLWNFGDNTATSAQENTTHAFANPGIYHVCFDVITNHNCTDSICQDITVIPAEVEAPNVITPNGDGVNDMLVFKYLEYYANNHVDIYDRWGKLLYEKDGYANDWNGSKFVDGTYYYVLTLKDTGKEYHGFFQLIK